LRDPRAIHAKPHMTQLLTRQGTYARIASDPLIRVQHFPDDDG
jgi:hypothetical protein